MFFVTFGDRLPVLLIDTTTERIPFKFLRVFRLFFTQMGPKVDFAPGAIRILLCCNQT